MPFHATGLKHFIDALQLKSVLAKRQSPTEKLSASRRGKAELEGVQVAEDGLLLDGERAAAGRQRPSHVLHHAPEPLGQGRSGFAVEDGADGGFDFLRGASLGLHVEVAVLADKADEVRHVLNAAPQGQVVMLLHRERRELHVASHRPPRLRRRAP